jgi:hypothetical protein
MTRPYRIVGDDCFITLNDGTEVVVDADQAYLVTDYCWSFWPSSRTVRRLIQKNTKRVSRHIADVVNPSPEGFINDHRDGDTHNNRRSNLRFATQSQNTMNRRRNLSKEGFKGVSTAKGRRFRARIRVDGKTHYLGVFDNPEEAARAYDTAARELHGEFACLNFPDLNERQA